MDGCFLKRQNVKDMARIQQLFTVHMNCDCISSRDTDIRIRSLLVAQLVAAQLRAFDSSEDARVHRIVPSSNLGREIFFRARLAFVSDP